MVGGLLLVLAGGGVAALYFSGVLSEKPARPVAVAPHHETVPEDTAPATTPTPVATAPAGEPAPEPPKSTTPATEAKPPPPEAPKSTAPTTATKPPPPPAGPQDLILGLWELVEPPNQDVTLEFRKDGTLHLNERGNEVDSTWKFVDAKTLELELPGPMGKLMPERMKVQLTRNDLVMITTDERKEVSHFQRSTGQPPPPKVIAADVWKEYTSRQGRFTALFPGKPQEEIQGPASPYHSCWVRQGANLFQVTYSDLPAELAAGGARAVYEQFEKQGGSGRKNKKDIEVDGQPGLEYVTATVTDNRPSDCVRRILAIKDRLYEVSVSYPVAGGVSPEDRQKFLDSFHPVYDPTKTEIPSVSPPPTSQADNPRERPMKESPSVRPGMDEDSVAKALEALGATVERDQGSPGKPVVLLRLNGKKVTGADLEGLAALKHLKKLVLIKNELTDADTKVLGSLSSLETLICGDNAVGDATLQEVGKLTALQTLNMGGTNITNAGLNNLGALKELRDLDLNTTMITLEGAEKLAELQKLEALKLSFTHVSDAGLKSLGSLANLQTLELARTGVDDAGLEELAGMKKLRTLNLSGTGVTDAGLKHLAGLEALESLNLAGDKVTDGGLRELSGLKKLNMLSVVTTSVTAGGVADLQKALPNCKIYK